MGQMMLLASWVRRKRFEAQLLAQELAKLLGSGATSAPAVPTADTRVSPDQMLEMMGVTL